MGQFSLADDYPRSVKVISHINQFTCRNRYLLRVVPPEDMLEAKELYCEIVFQFDGDVDPADRKISRIGVSSETPQFQDGDAQHFKYLDKEFVADSNGLLHINLDLTTLLVSKTGDNWVDVQFPAAFFSDLTGFGTFKLWKLDLVHTTEGVRSRTA